MEGGTTLIRARELFGDYLLGPREIGAAGSRMELFVNPAAPPIPWTDEAMERYSSTHLLVLAVAQHNSGEAITLASLRKRFRTDPLNPPCFYNQEWFLREAFFLSGELQPGWHLIEKAPNNQSRAQDPEKLAAALDSASIFPSAVLLAYVFLLFYLSRGGRVLWEHDYLWCADRDGNGDRIYVGHYHDPAGLSQSGFEIHRFLTLRDCYGLAAEVGEGGL